MHSKLLVIDTETTHLDISKAQIFQIGAIYQRNNLLTGINLHMKPLNLDQVSIDALQKTNHTIEQLQSYEDNYKAYLKFRNFLISETSDGEKFIPVAYNTKYDLAVLESWFKAYDAQDTIYKYLTYQYIDMYEIIKFAKSLGLYPEKENLRLESFFIDFGFDPSIAHDAYIDSQVCWHLYTYFSKFLLNKIPS